MEQNMKLRIYSLPFLSATTVLGVIACVSTPVHLPVSNIVEIKNHSYDLAIKEELQSFLSDNRDGWRATHQTRAAPIDYIVIKDASGNLFSLGYSEQSIVRYWTSYYYYKTVPGSEVNRLKQIFLKLKAQNPN